MRERKGDRYKYSSRRLAITKELRTEKRRKKITDNR